MKHSVAIKKGMRPNEMMKEFINMKAIERGMARDNSPRLKNIAKACGFNDAKNELYLELIQGMKLVQFVESVENLSMDDKIRLMNVVVDTLEDIHEAGYTHGDVHDRNIIMQYDPPGSGEASDDFENTVQLIDFGHSEADTTPREIWDQWNYFFLNLFDVEYIVDDLPSGLTREMVSDWKRRFMNDQD
jgi:serine/threonine protein kinase